MLRWRSLITGKRLPIAAAGALVTLVACASIAGLEDPDEAPSNGGADGGDGRQPAPGISVTPEALTLTASCAGAGDPAFITIKNDNDTTASYELQVPEGSAFALRDPSDASVANVKGSVPPKGLVLVYLRATPTKAGNFPGQVIVSVNGEVTQVPVQVTVNGGSLSFSPDLVDFGEVRQQTTSPPQTIEIVNTGTEAVNVLGLVQAPASDAGAEFAIDTGTGSLNIAPGGKATATATLLPGAAGPPVSAVYEPQTQEPTCGALPKLTLEGTRVNQDVTVNPVSLDFGEVDCQSAGGATRTITVSNYATNMPAEFAVTTPPNSWFEVSADSTSVPPANGAEPGKRTITVKLKAVGSAMGNHSDPIEVDVKSPVPGKKTTATASVKSVGGVLSISPVTLSGFSMDQTRSFGVRNTGNKFVYVRHTSSNTNAFTIVNGTSASPLTPGSFLPLNVDVKFVAQAAGTYQADITTERGNAPPPFPQSGNLCEPAPVVKASATK